jgi:hypothetical protein
MFKALWEFFKSYRRRVVESQIRILDAEILSTSRKLMDLLSRQRELQRRYAAEKHIGERFSTDEFVTLHVDVPLEIKWMRDEFDKLTARRAKLEERLGGASVQSFFITVA